jgi:hypothetical protein
MSANPLDPEAVTEKLIRLKRLATAAILFAAVSLAVAVAALVAPYNPELRAHVERFFALAPPSPVVQSAPVHGELEAEGFVLRDKDGRLRADLFVANDDMVHLNLVDHDDRPRAILTAGTNGGGLVLLDGSGQVRLGLAELKSSLGLELYDAIGHSRLHLGLDAGDALSLRLFDKDEKVRATFGSASLAAVATGATEQTAESSLVLFDKAGKVIFRVPPD